METKNILQYIILAAVVFLSIVGIINLLEPSPILNNSKQTIESVLKIVTESKEIITNQTKTIDKLQPIYKPNRLKKTGTNMIRGAGGITVGGLLVGLLLVR